jgi:geranylgeranyl pyrophosphate synthase
MNLGIAFQLSDDVLDLTADTESLGKEAGSDLLEGKLTLPLIYLLEEDPGLKSKLEKVMFDGEYSAISREELRLILDKHRIIERIKERADDHSDRARKSLDVLSKSEYRSCLEDVLSFVAERKN